MLDSNIHDFDASVSGPGYVAPTDIEPTQVAGEETAVSSIEKSKSVAVPHSPAMDFPILAPPGNDGETLAAMVTLVSQGKVLEGSLFLLSQMNKMNEIITDMLDKWNENLKEIEKQTQELLNSPLYQALQALRLKGDVVLHPAGDQSSSSVAGVDASTTSVPTMVSQIQILERVPAAGSVAYAEETDNQAKLISIPILAAVFAGGAFALQGAQMTTTVWGPGTAPIPTVGAVDLANRLQPLLPALLPLDVMLTINLMAMPLIYYTAWDTAIGSLRNRNQNNDMETAQKFAKEVIRIITDPQTMMTSVVQKIGGSEKILEQFHFEQMAMLKLILSSVALGLLYSTEVGKVQQGQFWGMEPQEFQGMLTGQIPIPDPKNTRLSTNDQLKWTLVSLIKHQFSFISSAKARASVMEAIFEYLSEKRDVESMLEPSKVFVSVLQSSAFKAVDIGGAGINPA